MDVLGSTIGACPAVGIQTLGQLAELCYATPGCLAFTLFQRPGQPAVRYCLKAATSPFKNQAADYMRDPCQGFFTRE